jgi:hypothetical protein
MHMQLDPSKISIGPDGKVIIDDQAVLTHLAATPDGFGTDNKGVCTNSNTGCTNENDCTQTSNASHCTNLDKCNNSTVVPPT